MAELFLTDNCNLKCVSCACWREQTRGELTTDEWRDVLDQLADLRFVKLNFTGGEALVRRDAGEVISYARSLGFQNLHLNTNGLQLNRRRLAEVLGAGVRSFNISVDGANASVHDAIRGRSGSFDAAIGAVRLLAEHRDRYGLNVRMNFTVLAGNVEEIPAVARLARDLEVTLSLNLGTDRTFLFRHEDVGQLLDVDGDALRASLRELERMVREDPRGLPSRATLRYIPSHFGLAADSFIPCAESQLKLMIRSTGEIGGCWGHDSTMNVRDHSIRSIVDSAEYRAEHERLFRKDCVRCGSNYALNVKVDRVTRVPYGR